LTYSDDRVETAEIGQPSSRLWFVIIVDQRSGVRLLCPAMNAAENTETFWISGGAAG
jgi:hypothetical protein